MNTNRALLPSEIREQLITPQQIAPPPGIPTGFRVIDDFLLWQGLPQGELCLFEGKLGLGATSLWLEAARHSQSAGQWVAYVGEGFSLTPQHLEQRQLDLSKLLVVKKPQDEKKYFWLLQELISSSLFASIGCHIQKLQLKTHQLQKLRKLCRTYKVALVFISESPPPLWYQGVFALSIHFKNNLITITRALHRLTPFSFDGSFLHAHSLPQIFYRHR